MGDVTIDGALIHSERDLHRQLEAQLELGDHYGRNLAALRDRLLADVPRPVRLIWRDSATSRKQLGDEFFIRVTALLEEVAQQDVEFGWDERFEYLLV